MSTLMFWNKQNAANQNNETKNGKRNWLHAPDALLNGHVVYLVKFFGNTPVEQAKGIEVVKDAIRRLQFAQQMKKAETGNNPKTKKVEITVSVDGVAVQEPRTQKVLHQFPLHNISYCADEKGVKKFFSFIAKNGQQPVQNGMINTSSTTTTTTNGHSEEGHECFVFISSKLASDITLTIGQAFDLAYRRYVNESGKTTELAKVQTQNKQLERTVTAYKNRLKELSELIPKPDLDRLLSRLCIRDIYEVPIENGIIENHVNGNKSSESESSNDDKLLIETSKGFTPPMIPPRNLQNQINTTLDAFKAGGQKMDELLLNSDSDSDFDPRADENDNGNKISNDLFGFEPPKTFGQQLFTNNNNNIINNNINNNNNNNNNNLTNGMNGSAPPISPPPLLAPPPKAAIPRRIVPSTNGNINNNNGSQDLFGSTPFNPNATSIFDDNIGSDTYKASTSFNEIALNTSSFTNPITKAVPSLELNSNVFDEDVRNPFNESGIYDMNDSKLNSVLPDINTLADNLNKLDGILMSKSPSLTESTAINTNTVNQNPLEKSTVNPFAAVQASPEGKTKEKSNPFKKAETFLGPRSASNYDALRNSPEIEAMMQASAPTTTPTTAPVAKKTPSPNYDLFKEAASAAFSELNGGGNVGPAKHANEFSNKMAGLYFNSQSSSNFGHKDQSNFNSNKTLLVDDFSLESLDPLRK